LYNSASLVEQARMIENEIQQKHFHFENMNMHTGVMNSCNEAIVLWLPRSSLGLLSE
jgi:hypothetical protein